LWQLNRQRFDRYNKYERKEINFLKFFDNISINELLSSKNSYLDFENQELIKEVDRLNKIFVLRMYHFLRKKYPSRLIIDGLEKFFESIFPISSKVNEVLTIDSQFSYMRYDEWVEGIKKVCLQEDCKVLVAISHEMTNTGAPTVLFDFLEVASKQFGVKVFVINCRNGDKSSDFINTFPTILLPQPNGDVSDFLTNIVKSKNVRILLNTIAHLEWADLLCEQNVDFVLWQHEQKISWKFFQRSFDNILTNAKRIFVGSHELKRDLVNYRSDILSKINYHDYGLNFKIIKSRIEIDQLLQIEQDTRIILLAGSRSIRKGFDLLPKFAKNLSKYVEEGLPYIILWIGDSVSNELDFFVVRDISRLEISDNILVCGGMDNYADFFNRADVVVHLAREDTKPQVLMLASKIGCPIVTFNGIGMDSEKFENLVQISYQDFPSMTQKVNKILKTGDNRKELQKGSYNDWEKVAPNMINELYSDVIVKQVNTNTHFVKKDSAKAKTPNIPVSVIIPNYNHEKFIKERINSILDQKYRPQEIILLDDASKDKSLDIAESILKNQNIPYQIYTNEINSGSPINQWANGISLANSPLVWIAESDDLSKPEFLTEAVESMARNSAQVYLCESIQIDESGVKTNFRLEDNYQLIPCALNANHNDQEIVFRYKKLLTDGMNLRNLFINVSSMVFYKDAISKALNATLSVMPNRHIADWFVYLNLDQELIVNFSRSRNNLFRKSENSLTFSKTSLNQVLLGREEIFKFIVKNKEVLFYSEMEFENWKIKFKFENYRIDKITK
jgi:glycosyltransferase involved in cell wall biosynthesis